MATYRLLLLAGCLITLNGLAGTRVDKKDIINGVRVESGKNNSTRFYTGTTTKTLPYSMKAVASGIVNFSEKCNNAFSDKRKFTNKNIKCRYHNDNLVETLVIKNIKTSGWQKESGEVERYILGRKIYNRGDFGHHELVRIYEGKNSQDQKTVTIVQTMLDDKDVTKYTNPSFSKDSAFDKANSIFTLTEVKANETQLNYHYTAQTDHWILNKEVSIPQVFSSMSKSINDLVKAVSAESSVQHQDLASN
jgi:hypothetical protein